jgi:chromate reductase, NAD(P)H dehydrogenase (quinone)
VTVSPSTSPRVAVVLGSARRASLNRRLAVDVAARLGERGVSAEVVDLGDYALPIYHGDDEALHGPPPAAVALHERLAAMDGVIFVSPEYNGSLPGLLKNAIDWVSRVDRSTFHRWLVGFAATSPGTRGARNVLSAMRHIADHMRLATIPVDLSVAHGGEAFDDGDPNRLSRPDVVAAADEFIDGYVAALDDWVANGRDARHR